MVITKEFKIHSIKTQQSRNAPFTIYLEGSSYDVNKMEEKWPRLNLSADDFKRFGIPKSLEIVGRTIIATMTVQSPLITDRSEEVRDEVEIEGIWKMSHSVVNLSDGSINDNTERKLLLETWGDGTRCPSYHLPVSLSQEEFDHLVDDIRRFPTHTVCNLKFTMAPE